jgi:hypothetical protein
MSHRDTELHDFFRVPKLRLLYQHMGMYWQLLAIGRMAHVLNPWRETCALFNQEKKVTGEI